MNIIIELKKHFVVLVLQLRIKYIYVYYLRAAYYVYIIRFYVM